MAKQDLYEKSPVRLFEKATGASIGSGEIALVAAKKGLGKTSVLVQFGMDTLLSDKQLVHVTFDLHSSNVISWYDSIFMELAKKKSIANPAELKDEVVRNRTILNFSLDNFSLSKVVNTLGALKQGGIAVSGVVMDGVDFAKVSDDDLNAVAKYAKDENVTVWMSSDSIPAGKENVFGAILELNQKSDGVALEVKKLAGKTDVAVSLKLDSKTLLISDK